MKNENYVTTKRIVIGLIIAVGKCFGVLLLLVPG
jgi:hypothetical protein